VEDSQLSVQLDERATQQRAHGVLFCIEVKQNSQTKHIDCEKRNW